MRKRDPAYLRAVDRALRSRKFQSWHRGVDFAHKQYKRDSLEPEPKFKEQHFTPARLAKLWGTSSDTIRRIFEPEPGVLKIGDPKPRSGRKYVSLRIPESIALRVHNRLSSVPTPIKVSA